MFWDFIIPGTKINGEILLHLQLHKMAVCSSIRDSFPCQVPFSSHRTEKPSFSKELGQDSIGAKSCKPKQEEQGLCLSVVVHASKKWLIIIFYEKVNNISNDIKRYFKS